MIKFVENNLQQSKEIEIILGNKNKVPKVQLQNITSMTLIKFQIQTAVILYVIATLP